MARSLLTAFACCMMTWMPAFAQQSTSSPPPEVDLLRSELQRLDAELTHAIGDPLAADLSACASVAVGAKACGGPTHFRVYSTTAADAGRVASLAADYTRTQRRLNELTGAVSDCMVISPPALALVHGRCAAAGAGSSSATQFSPAPSR